MKKGKSVLSALLSALAGALLFIFLYGTKVLDPSYDLWLFKGNDLTQHYVGWEFFRAADWGRLPGIADNLIHPYELSVILTDSIPLFAVIKPVGTTMAPRPLRLPGSLRSEFIIC